MRAVHVCSIYQFREVKDFSADTKKHMKRGLTGLIVNSNKQQKMLLNCSPKSLIQEDFDKRS